MFGDKNKYKQDSEKESEPTGEVPVRESGSELVEVVASHNFLCRGVMLSEEENVKREFNVLSEEDALPVQTIIYKDGRRKADCTGCNSETGICEAPSWSIHNIDKELYTFCEYQKMGIPQQKNSQEKQYATVQDS